MAPSIVGVAADVIDLITGGEADGIIDLLSTAYVQNVDVRNQMDGCGLGEGIDSENSYVTIASNEIHNVDNHGILETGGTNLIAFNLIQNSEYGIVLSGAKRSFVSANKMSTALGIQLDTGTTGVTVTGNTISPFASEGIYLIQASANKVTNNDVSASYIGLALNGSSGNIVQGNAFSFSQAYGIADNLSGGGNVVTNNTINEAALGLYSSAANGDTLTPNNFFNCVVTTGP